MGDVAPENEGRFYRGTILKLFHGSRSGVVRSIKGREHPFAFPHVVMLGQLRRFEDLREGMAVGFDVGRTSKGLRVTVLHTGDTTATPGSPSETTGSDP
jgi:hypothetical protein